MTSKNKKVFSCLLLTCIFISFIIISLHPINNNNLINITSIQTDKTDEYSEASFKPYGIHLTSVGDPTSSIIIQWYTDVKFDNSAIKYGKDPFNLNLSAYIQTKIIENTWLYWVNITNLNNNTKYFYQIGGNIFNFTTAPGRRSPTSFLVWGDSRTDRVPRQNLAKKASELGGFDFTLHGGDIVEDGGKQRLWCNYFSDLTPLSHIPSYYAIGNHDLNQIMFDNIIMSNYYTFNYGPIQIIVLDSVSNMINNTLLESWLQSGNSDNATLWKVVVFHHPMFEIREGREDYQYGKENWGPIFQTWDLDLLFVSHSHFFHRTYPVDYLGNFDNSTKFDYVNLTDDGKFIQICSGGAGAPLYDNVELQNWSAVYHSKYHFQRVLVNFNLTHTTMNIETWAMPMNFGELYILDNITLTKNYL